MLRRYEEWRGKSDFMLSPVNSNSCGRCFLALPPQRIAELRRGDKLISCNSCGRVLVWHEWLDKDD
jgi:predicted  nucleic acid-binding Zn-ribbon protein